MAARSLVDSKQAEEVVQGIPTEVVCTAFANTILVVVTQYGKMGTLVSVEPNVVADGISSPLLTTKVLLGKDEVCSFFLPQFISEKYTLPACRLISPSRHDTKGKKIGEGRGKVETCSFFLL